MRLFAGLYPPEDAAAHLAARVDDLHVSRAAVNTRLAPRAQWHVTVVFLGEVPDDQFDAVDTTFKTTISPGTAPVRLRIAGGGRFGTILWAGLTGDLDRLTAISDSLRRGLKRARLPFDRKPLRPHLTLARPGDRLEPDLLAADRDALDGYAGLEWTATHLRLMRSQLGSAPVYTELARYPL